MKHIDRALATQILKAVKAFPALVLTGPRRAGKTWLLRRPFPTAEYYLLEDPDLVARFRADPQGFLDGIRTPAIIVEVQHVPEALDYPVAARSASSSCAAAPTQQLCQWLFTMPRTALGAC